jgi:hypothetical protein
MMEKGVNKWHFVENEFATQWWHNGGKLSKYSTNFPP